VAQAFNLVIQPTLKTKDTKIIAGIAAFVENSDIMRKELEKRSLRAAKAVAPERMGGLKKAIEISRSTETGYTLGVSESLPEGEDAAPKVKFSSDPDERDRDYDPYLDGGSQIRANMQEFGYPYEKRIWGPYQPNPNAPKGDGGLGYLRYGQVLAAKSLTKDYISYGINVTEAEVVNYEKTIEKYMTKAYEVILAKYLRKQKLPLYYRGIDTLKQKAPIPSRAKGYGNVTNLDLSVDLAFPRNPYSYLESGRQLANISKSVTGKEFALGYRFLIK
jgi:hypothetical protein